MKIGLLFDGLSLPPKDGVTYRAYHIAKKLAQKKVDVVFYLGDRGWTTDNEIKNEFSIPCVLFPATWLYDGSIQKVAKLIEYDHIDVLHVCNSHPVVLIYGRALADILDIPLVCDMHDVDHILFSSLSKSKKEIDFAKTLQYVTGACSDKIISMSSVDYTQLLELGIPKKKLHYIPNGISTQQYLNRKVKNFHCVFLGNLFYEPNYNAVQLIINDIAPRVWCRYPLARFTCIGRKPSLFTKISDRRLQIVGEVDDLEQYFSTATVGIAPLFEGSGMKVKVLTYAAYGLPVIASPIALMGYDDDQYFYKAHSAAEFADQICNVFENEGMAISYGKHLYDMVNKRYSWDVLVDQLLGVYSNAQKDLCTRFILSGECNDSTPVILSDNKIPQPLWLTEKRFTEYKQSSIVVRRLDSHGSTE